MTTTIQHQERVLCGQEEELVCVLSGKDPVEIADDFYKKNVLSNAMWDLFTSLDHSNLEPQLLIRYLLRLVCKKLQEDNCVWAKFLNLLSDMGGNFNAMRKKLEEELDKVSSSVEIRPLISTASRESDIVLTRLDANDLTELLAKISCKWEEVGIALKLPKHVREKCRCRDKDIISLTNIITSWLSGEANTPTNTTLHTLKKALCGPIVAEPSIAEEVKEKFIPVESPRLSLSQVGLTDSHLTIINQSGNTVVADGRSTLLLVQASHRESASYQWKKDGHVLVNNSTYLGVCEEILVISRARQGTEGEYTCCVSSEGRQASSNKIILTVEYSAAKKRLLDLYSVTSEVPSDSWPPSGAKTFINLVLIKSSREPTNITGYTVERSADKVIEEREKVEYEQVFRECNSGELILLEGRPGSGKTTLVHKIIKDWTKGSMLENARWVMLITLRELNTIRAESLSDVVGYFSQSDEAIAKNIERDTGEGLCFIIDGLDEYQPSDKTKSLVYQLLNKTLLSKAMIIVSSRPSAIKSLDWKALTKHIEILGLSREEIFQYIDNFPFSCESDITTSVMYATQLKEYLHSNSSVLNMCYLPVHAAMICYLFKCKRGNIPITQTQIYEQFTSCIILRHLKRSNSKQLLESLQDLEGDIKAHFNELCRLAFEMTVNSKQVVIQQHTNIQLSDSSVAEDTRYLGLVTISHTAGFSGFHSTYTFLHLTFQQFLAAVYMSSLNEEDQLKMIKECDENHMLTVLTFYCGLVRFSSGDIRIQELFKKFSYDHNNLLQFAFESQQSTICDEVVKHGWFSYLHLSPSSLLAFNYIMSSTSTPITELTFFDDDDDDVVTALLNVLLLNKNKLCHLLELRIPYITNKDQVLLLADVLIASSNLRNAGLHFKHIDADGMKCVADTLKSLSHLQQLYLYVNNISNGITQLFSGLQHLQCTELYFYFKDHSTNCAVELGKGLQLLTINRMYRLELTDGSVGAEGADALGKGLLNLTELQDLILSNNNISDEEVNYLSVGIKSLSNLHELDVSHNNIGPCGATSLAGAMQLLNLTCLNLSSNNIGCEGARTLANTLPHLKHLDELYLSGTNIDLDSAIVVIEALKNCSCRTACINMTEQDDKIYDCSIQVQGLVSLGDDVSIAALVAAVQHNTQDRKLELGFNKIIVPANNEHKCN